MADLRAEGFISEWAFDPNEVPEARALQGYLGNTTRTSNEVRDDGAGTAIVVPVSWWRLYSTLSLGEYIEFPESDVLFHRKITVASGAPSSELAEAATQAQQTAQNLRAAIAAAANHPQIAADALRAAIEASSMSGAAPVDTAMTAAMAAARKLAAGDNQGVLDEASTVAEALEATAATVKAAGRSPGITRTIVWMRSTANIVHVRRNALELQGAFLQGSISGAPQANVLPVDVSAFDPGGAFSSKGPC